MLHNLLFKAIFDQDYPNLGRLCNMLVPSSIYARAQPGGDTVAHDPQGYRQQAAWEYVVSRLHVGTS